ncbi:MAG: radical SAM protein [Candidatus Omnitrophota bacterium]|nr:radical SAM protein [Candidatus Omnitrophota bacterium]
MNKKVDVVLFGSILPPADFRITPGSFPLGLLALAPILKQKGLSVEVISGAFRDAHQRLEDTIKRCRYFGVSSMTGPYLKMAIDVSKAVKRKYPHIPIIWGGVHATLLYEETIKEDYVDVIVRGMGEDTLWSLIEALEKGLPLSNIKGITYKINGRIISNSDIDIPDINKFPSFDYSDFLSYRDDISELPYISSRGCPYGCTFCVASKLYNRKYYFYSAERMFEDISGLVDAFGCNRFTFWDDNLFVIKDRLKNFCRLLVDNDIKIKWSAFCHCDLFLKYDDEMVRLMKEAGLENISFGAESGSLKILNLIKKKITPEQIVSCVLRTKEFNIDADFTFMTGFPQETMDDFKQTLSLFKEMLKINPDISIRLFAFTPYPKIPILEQEPSLAQYFPNTIDSWAILTYQNYIPQWLDKGRQKLIDNIVWMVNFLSRKQRPKTQNIFFNLLLYLYHLSALFRLKINFLSYAFEWKLFKFAYKINARLIVQKTTEWKL